MYIHLGPANRFVHFYEASMYSHEHARLRSVRGEWQQLERWLLGCTSLTRLISRLAVIVSRKDAA